MKNSPRYGALSVLGDSTRQRIMDVLVDGERSVSDIASQLPVTRSAVSQHLKCLAGARLIECRAQGKLRCYRLSAIGLNEAARQVTRWAKTTSSGHHSGLIGRSMNRSDPKNFANPKAIANSQDSVDVTVTTIIRTWPEANALSVAILTRIHLLAREMRQSQERIARAHGITGPEVILLSTLRRFGEPYTSTPTQLARRALLSAPGMNKHLAKLLRQGLIERRIVPDDGRVRLIALTAKGARITDSVVGAQFTRNEELVEPLQRHDLEQLADTLRRLWLDVSKPR